MGMNQSEEVWTEVNQQLQPILAETETVESVSHQNVSTRNDEDLLVTQVSPKTSIFIHPTTDDISDISDFITALPKTLQNILNIRPLIDENGDLFIRLSHIIDCFESESSWGPRNSLTQVQTETKLLPALPLEVKIEQFQMMAENITYINQEVVQADIDCTMEICDRKEDGFSARISKELLPVQYLMRRLLLPTDFPLWSYLTAVSDQSSEYVQVEFDPIGVETGTDAPLRVAQEVTSNSVMSTLHNLSYYCENCSENSAIPLITEQTVLFSCVNCPNIKHISKDQIRTELWENHTPISTLITKLPQEATTFTGIDSIDATPESTVKTQYTHTITTSSGTQKEHHIEIPTEDQDSADTTYVHEYDCSTHRRYKLQRLSNTDAGELQSLMLCGNCGQQIINTDEQHTNLLLDVSIYDPETDKIIPTKIPQNICKGCLDTVRERVTTSVNEYSEIILSNTI